MGGGLLAALGFHLSLLHAQQYSQEFHIKFWDGGLGQVHILEPTVIGEEKYINWPRGHKGGVSLIYTQTWVGGGVAWLPRENPGVVTGKGGWVLDRWIRQLCDHS